MQTFDRRRFLMAAGAGAVAAALPAVPALAAATPVTSSGKDLTGWTTVLGDGLYASAGQAAVNLADVATENKGTYSRLRANVAERGVMAHVIAYRKIAGSGQLRLTHRGSYSFRLPFLPSTTSGARNAQTVEGGLFIWNGDVDYGTAFQWVLNPWQDDFGAIQVWTGDDWESAGYLKPDTSWHRIALTVEPTKGRVAIALDGRNIPAPWTVTEKDEPSTDPSVRLQAEAISLYPGTNATWAPQHEVQVRDWSWTRG
ncbi:hypothetical protein [Actinoplanes sp. NBRC 101535]|uniref:hypothetical protein n=1 Tax=Actinoplanes sp. NBRC 101535 TaxID=3032196 RepID=UPI0024A3584D|nr:hypothetical protein [Actinoplanes sp. NBRC 101535]GLX99944.1 hypothetical protein Acsp01_03240 [Actinoplanes sp. NBRC 101535]